MSEDCGLYIPMEILRMDMPWSHKLVASEIAQFQKCFAQREHFQERFGLSKNSVLDAFRTLEKDGLIVRVGRVRRVTFKVTTKPKNGTFEPETSSIEPEIGAPKTSTIKPKTSTAELKTSTSEPKNGARTQQEIEPEVKQEIEQEDILGVVPPTEKAPRQRDLIFDAISEVCNLNPADKAHSGQIARCKQRLKAQNVTESEIRTAGEIYALQHPFILVPRWTLLPDLIPIVRNPLALAKIRGSRAPQTTTTHQERGMAQRTTGTAPTPEQLEQLKKLKEECEREDC